MKKIYQVSNCAHCPNSTDIHGKMYCAETKQISIFSNYREITRQDKFVLDERGNALDNKFPEWYLLEDCKQ